MLGVLQLTWKAMISDSMLRAKAQVVHVHQACLRMFGMFRDLFLSLKLVGFSSITMTQVLHRAQILLVEFYFALSIAAMTNLVDSTAQFESRLKEIGLNQPFIDLVKGHGVQTLSQLGFAVGQPGQPINNGDVDQFLTGALGRVPTINEAACIKRAAFEAHTMMVATIRQSVDRSDDVPKKIPFAERVVRMQALEAELAGISITGEHDPAHGLLDKACNIYDSNTLKYLDPASCISRALEIQGGSKNQELTLQKGSLVLKAMDDKLTSPTDSEIKVHYAMVRRAIAFRFAKLMSFSQHCEWENFLFEALHRDAPPGYSKPTLSQALMCDRAAFSRLTERATEVRQRADQTYPLGEALLALRNDPNLALYLSPLATRSTGGAPSQSSTWRPQPYQQERPGKSKGKGKSKKGRSGPPIPNELRGKYHKTPSGEPICFGFNCSTGCSDKSVQPGGRCARGLHVCAEPKCGQPHSLQNHGKQN